MTTTWSASVYTQERSILTINASSGVHNVVITTTNPAGYSARYIYPSSRTLKIDLSDLVRISTSGSFSIQEYTENGTAIGTATALTWTQAGRIAPRSVLAPPSPLWEDASMELYIMAPTVLLKAINTNTSVQFEMYGTDGYDFATGRVRFMPNLTGVNFAETMEVPANTTQLEFWHLDDFNKYTIPVKELECDKRYVMVEWVSYTGKTRRHAFEVVKATTETTEEVDIATITNEYDPRKNRRDSFTLRLDGLSRYDVWYYSDLITSSSVKVSFNGTTWHQVQVTAKKQTIPETDCGASNVLEIPVNYRRYDTL